MTKPPKRFQKFTKDYPKVSAAYDTLGEAVHAAGPLDAKMRALAVGATPEEIHHAVLLAMPTIGLPPMMAALSWVDDILDEGSVKKK